ncbi:MAG: hypothetical protein ABFE07_20625 [Armatimonadia bacterium]
MADTIGHPPTTEQIGAWQQAYRTVAAAAVADILAAQPQASKQEREHAA